MARKNKIALAPVILILLLIVFDPRLALFALGGFVIGAVVLFLVWPPRKPAPLVSLALLILLGAALFYFQQEKAGVQHIVRMNYAYTGTITFVRATSAWSIEDQVTFPDEKKINQFLKKASEGDGQVPTSVADMMAKTGWQREEVVGATAARYTKTRTQSVINRWYPIHTTNTIDLPVFQAGNLPRLSCRVLLAFRSSRQSMPSVRHIRLSSRAMTSCMMT